MSPRRWPSSAPRRARSRWSRSRAPAGPIPAGLQRPGLQRVQYFLENGTLRREYWNVLDPTLASKTVRHDLLEHVKSFQLRYLDINHNWQMQWPPPTSCLACNNEQAMRQRPLAVEITIETADWGKIVRIIEVAA